MTSIQGPAPSSTSDRRRRPYHQPRLRVLGELRELTKGTGATANGDGGQNMMVDTGSDRSIKENIVQIGRHPLGFGLYWFDYKPEFQDLWGHGRRFGVMADEVAIAVPSAVRRHTDGYLTVNYAAIGLSIA